MKPGGLGLFLGLALLVPILSGALGPQATVRVEVRIPERVALWLEAPDLGAGGSLRGPLWAGRGGGSPAQPPYCPRNPLDPSLCLRDPVVVFDLRCATLGPVPPHCASLYGGDGRFLDEEGRPYPPLLLDSEGRVIPGSKRFPQFFTHPSMRLHVFTQAERWALEVAMEAEPQSPEGEVLDASHFAVHSILTGRGGLPPTPEWKCLAYHPDWDRPPSHICPAPQGPQGGVLLEEVADHPGGWQSVTLGIKLRLDGSEVPGEYEGLLVYTLTLL
ncbi:hypothetical protein ACLWNE_02700 [Thermus oshimai]|jgi:hypothetical protein|uniref:hypothetical protein n=1 Tax=Thermus oshimai TaxID=56957 RepID=UPI0039A4258A